MHDAVGRGAHEGDAKVEPRGQDIAALVHDASWRLPDRHLQHICMQQRTLSDPVYLSWSQKAELAHSRLSSFVAEKVCTSLPASS